MGKELIGLCTQLICFVYMDCIKARLESERRNKISIRGITPIRAQIVTLKGIVTKVYYRIRGIIELPSRSTLSSADEDFCNNQLTLWRRELQREAVYLTCSKLLNLPLRRNLSFSLLKHAIISVRSELHSHLTTAVKL